MSYAPSSVYFDTGDGTILGQFKHKDVGTLFEFSENTDEMTDSWQFKHKIWVLDGTQFRYANVLQTRAHIVVDEDRYGQPVIETWDIKQRIDYLLG